MGGFLDFVFGKGALKKAAGTQTSKTPAAPAQPAGLDIAGDAQRMADRARGNDGGIGTRGSTQPTQPNDAGIKARAKSLPKQPTQPNDVGLKGGSQDDDD